MIYLVIALVLMCIASVVQLIIILKLREEKDANLKEIRDLYDRLRVNALFTPQVTYMKTVPFTFQQTIPEPEFNLMKSEGYYIDMACKHFQTSLNRMRTYLSSTMSNKRTFMW